MTLQWTTLLNGYPSQSWTFVLAAENPYSLFLSWRVGQDGWRAFIIPNARAQRDLFGGEDGCRWSADVFAEAGVLLREEQLVEAQATVVRMLAQRLGLTDADVLPARNGRLVIDKRLTMAQAYQMAQTQPKKRRIP